MTDNEVLVAAKILHKADCGCDQDQSPHDEPYWQQAVALIAAGFHLTPRANGLATSSVHVKPVPKTNASKTLNLTLKSAPRP